MKVVVAPDSFKETMSAAQVAARMAAGVRQVWPGARVRQLPMADGGEGTLSVLVQALGGTVEGVTTVDAMGRGQRACLGWVAASHLAVVEVAQAVGLEQVLAADRNVMRASSAGVAALLTRALELGARRIIVGLGGSATNDGGVGMLRGLGARFYSEDGAPFHPTAESLGRLARVELSPTIRKLQEVDIVLACDVDNPLTGPQGASAVFGPQKGATATQVKILERNLANWGGILEKTTGTDWAAAPGAGAAGGLGFAFMAALGARRDQGAKVVAEAISLEAQLADADLVITGEGAIDSQTLRGKTISWVAHLAALYDVPIVAVGGSLRPGYENLLQGGFTAVLTTVRRVGQLPEILATAPQDLEQTTADACRLINLGLSLAGKKTLPSSPGIPQKAERQNNS
ncbi:MAG: glycerate kinase [Actinomycetaceae bacterium]|nr:glycerate kinase [Actinomycetaceae bacterium]